MVCTMPRLHPSSLVAIPLLGICLLAAAPAPHPRKAPAAPFVLTPERVHFDLQGLARSVHGELRPALPAPPEPEPGFVGEPANVRFLFDQEKGTDTVTSAQRQVVVYPAPAFRRIFVDAKETTGNPVDVLRAQLRKGSPGKAEIPILPPPDAAQVLKAHLKVLEFAGGRGFSFVTAYAQDNVPVANDALFYTFQGLTDDGKYWVAVYYPLAASVLPRTERDSPEAKDYKAFDAHFASYLKSTVRALEDPRTVYTPELAKLEALVRSISIR
jgi:hypothetical protein